MDEERVMDTAFGSAKSKSSIGKRPSKLVQEEEFQQLTVKRFKELSLNGHGQTLSFPPIALESSKAEQVKPSQALILHPLAMPEETFRLAIRTDFPNTQVGRLLSVAELGEPKNQLNEGLKDEKKDNEGKELVLYSRPLNDILKEACYLEEHQMSLD